MSAAPSRRTEAAVRLGGDPPKTLQHLIALYEAGSRDSCVEFRTYHHDPVALAKRALRLMNVWAGGPGGYDQLYSRASVHEEYWWAEAWPRICCVRITRLRAGRTSAEKQRRRERDARKRAACR